MQGCHLVPAVFVTVGLSDIKPGKDIVTVSYRDYPYSSLLPYSSVVRRSSVLVLRHFRFIQVIVSVLFSIIARWLGWLLGLDILGGSSGLVA